jgi:hypothetical protein
MTLRRYALATALAVILALGLWFTVKRDAADSTRTLGGLLIGAGVVALIDVLTDFRTLQRAAEDARRRDLDETRRLLYIAIVKDELGGTVMNALMHHSRTYNFSDALALALKVKSRRFDYGDAADVVEQINAELHDAAPSRSSHFSLGPAPRARPHN